MEADQAAHLVDGGDHLFFHGEDELAVEIGADEGSGGITKADEVGPGLELVAGEGDFHVENEGEEVADELFIIVEIEHEVVDATEISRLGAGTFDPAFDDVGLADGGGKQFDALDAIGHAATTEGIGLFEGGEGGGVGEEGVIFINGGGRIGGKEGSGAAVGGFAGGVGDDRDEIEVVFFGDAELSLGQDAVIGGVVTVGAAEAVGGEHHGDGHEGETVGMAVAD